MLNLNTNTNTNHNKISVAQLVSNGETEQVDWLITLFNKTFTKQQTVLVRGIDEPEYFPAQYHNTTELLIPAQIVFAHGFFASALHEISHWCIAGKKRRLLPDFGYWYEPDGRSNDKQHLFEQVEIKPQALEWIFTVLCGRNFRASIDNLSADITESTQFKQNIHKQVTAYLAQPQSIPRDAQILMYALAKELQSIDTHNDIYLAITDFCVKNC